MRFSELYIWRIPQLMKRCFRKALILALLIATALSPVSAETPEAFSVNIESEVPSADDTGDIGLVVDGQVPASQPVAEPYQTAMPETETPAYVRFPAEGAALLKDRETLAVVKGGVALVLSPDGDAAVYTDRGILVGRVDKTAVTPMTPQEVDAFFDAANEAGEAIALYNDDIDLPLARCACDFPDESVKKPDPAAQTGLEVVSAGGASATGIQLSASSVSIGVKEKYDALSVFPLPEGSVLEGVTWHSTNKSFVRVNAKTGVITGVKRGTATVYAKTKNGLKAACKVKVKAKPTAIAVTPTSMTVGAGMTRELGYTVSGGASGQLSFTSSKPEVASVDDTGVITALAPGKTTVTVKTYNGKSAKCKVRVLGAAASVAFPDDTYSIALGEKTTLTATAFDASGAKTMAEMTYRVDAASPDAGCVSLDPFTGEISALRKGRAIVTATTQNNIVASCDVVVASAPSGIRLNLTSATIGAQEVFAGLMAEPIPPEGEDVCATVLSWATSNAQVATVDVSGTVRGVSAGTCAITVSTENGKTATCAVNVLIAPASVSISPAVGALKVGKAGRYRVTLSPSGSGGSMSYASSDSSVASVDANGVVTANAEGTVDITVTTYNGKSATAQLVVSLNESEGIGDKTTSEKVKYLINLAKLQMGKPYIYGGGYSQEEPRGFDCSGLVYWLYSHVGIVLRDSAYRQGYDTRFPKVSMSELVPGDVVFFNTNGSDSDLSDHSALYVGNGYFIHASSTAEKVIVSNLSTPGSFYNRTFSWGRRILQ